MALRALEKMIHGKRLIAAQRVQRCWRRKQDMTKLQRKKYLARIAREKREHLAALLIIQSYQQLVYRRKATEIVVDKRMLRHVMMVVKIQTMYRGLVARAWRTEQLRLMLLQDLRDWAGGSRSSSSDQVGPLYIWHGVYS